MSANDADSGSPSTPPPSYAGTIVIVGMIALGVVWTYILVPSGLNYWMKGGASVVILFAMIAAWRWRQQRIAQQLEHLQRWAADDDARGQRKTARRSEASPATSGGRYSTAPCTPPANSSSSSSRLISTSGR